MKYLPNIIRSILTLLIFGVIFTFASNLTVDNMIDNLYRDIYVNADENSQDFAITNIKAICSNIFADSYYTIDEFKTLCKDKNRINNLIENCNTHYSEDCKPILSGEFNFSCKQLNSINPVNMTLLSNTCNWDLVNDEFFAKFMKAMTNIPNLDGSIYFFPMVGISVLLILFLFVFHKEDFVKDISQILFVIGRNLIIFMIILYGILYFVNIDTSPILNAMNGSLPPEQLILEVLPTLIPLVLKSVFDITYLIIGISFLLISIILQKLYKHRQASK